MVDGVGDDVSIGGRLVSEEGRRLACGRCYRRSALSLSSCNRASPIAAENDSGLNICTVCRVSSFKPPIKQLMSEASYVGLARFASFSSCA